MSLFDYSHYEPYEEMLSKYIELLERGEDPNERDENGNTVLHKVVSEMFESSCAITEDDIKIIKLLLENNADTNAQDRRGRTPIMCFDSSIRYSNKYLIFDILRDKTDLEIKDEEGRTFNDKYWEIKIEE